MTGVSNADVDVVKGKIIDYEMAHAVPNAERFYQNLKDDDETHVIEKVQGSIVGGNLNGVETIPSSEVFPGKHTVKLNELN